MIFYLKKLKKVIKKGLLPKAILQRFHNAFLSLDLTKDLGLFDIKEIKDEEIIDSFEKDEKKGNVSFTSFDDLFDED